MRCGVTFRYQVRWAEEIGWYVFDVEQQKQVGEGDENLSLIMGRAWELNLAGLYA